MSKSNATENALLLLIFNAVTWNDIAQNDASSPLTDLYVALHTADPGETGTAVTNETAYTSYARVAIARSGAGFTVTANSVSPAANIDFPSCTGSPAGGVSRSSSRSRAAELPARISIRSPTMRCRASTTRRTSTHCRAIRPSGPRARAV